jgi:hypothetical protein
MGTETIIEAFERIGLSAEEVMAMDRQELFEKTIAGLQNIESGAERSAVAYRLLSSDASTLASLLSMSNKQTAELRDNYSKLGAVMSRELIGKSLQFQMALSNLRVSVAGIANTFAEIFLPALTTIARVLTYIISIVNSLIRAIFGLEITTSASGTGAVAGGINGFGQMADSIDDATNSANTLKRTLMGFDELNVLDNGGSSNSSSIGNNLGLDTGLNMGGGLLGGDSLLNPEAIKLDGWYEFINKWQGLLSTIIPIGMKYIGIIGAVACLLSGNFVGALGFATLAGIGMGAINSSNAWGQIGQFFRDYNLGLIPIGLIGIGMLGAVMSASRGNWVGAIAFASLAGVGFHSITQGDGFQLDDIKSLASSISVECIPIVAMCGAVFALLRGNIPIAIGLLAIAGVSGIVGTLSRIGDGSAWDGFLIVFDKLVPTLTKYITPIVLTLLGVASLLLGNIPIGISLLMLAGVSGLTTHYTGKPIWANMLEIIKEAFRSFKGWFNENVLPMLSFEYWSKIFSDMVKAVKEKLGEARVFIEDTCKNISKYYDTNIAPKLTLSFWTKKFSTIKDGAKSAFNGLIDIVERAINTIIAKLNTLSWAIPEWVPAVGGKKFGFNLKQIKIPRLATGGITTGSTIANIGENGKEAILPLENNTQWMDALADKIASRSQSPSKIVLKVGERELGWATINSINQITRQAGEL